jgi:hypothetical protein
MSAATRRKAPVAGRLPQSIDLTDELDSDRTTEVVVLLHAIDRLAVAALADGDVAWISFVPTMLESAERALLMGVPT